ILVTPVMLASFSGQPEWQGCRSLSRSLAVCGYQICGNIPDPACSQSVAVNRAAGSSTTSQETFKSRRRLPARRGLRIRLQQLEHQPIAALALAFEIGAVTRGHGFEPHDLGLHRHELWREVDAISLATTGRARRVPDLPKIHADQRFAILRQRALQ